MHTRELGRTGLRVSALGLGCMGMSEFYGPTDDEQSIRVIHRAIDRGVTFLDTADIYGIGHNEWLVGRALRELRGGRQGVVLATKFGNQRDITGGWLGINGRPAYVHAACDASLRRLRVEHIDLYYQHRVDPAVPIEETVGAMAEMVKAGKVRFLGLSEAAPATLRRAARAHPIAALQSEYSLWTRDVEEEVLPTCRELGIGLVAYSPLGRKFLTGGIRSESDLPAGDRRHSWPRFTGENLRQNLELVGRLEALAQAKGVKPSQLALAWLLAQGEDVVPIPGTKRLEYLEENVAAEALRLTAAEVRRIGEAAPRGAAAGQRYPAEGMQTVNR